jgi:hypothetical protein
VYSQWLPSGRSDCLCLSLAAAAAEIANETGLLVHRRLVSLNSIVAFADVSIDVI